jgi:hypothetical protein
MSVPKAPEGWARQPWIYADDARFLSPWQVQAIDALESEVAGAGKFDELGENS